jgi:secondary thiamine-phosphate synthase enzyme
MRALTLTTSQRAEFIDITSQVERVLAEEKVTSGICFVFCPHTTAGLTINENADPSVRSDIIRHLEELVPHGKGYSHSEGNSDAHIKASLMGFSLSLIIEEGRLKLGTWQGVYFCEFDGPRHRQVYITVIEKKR